MTDAQIKPILFSTSMVQAIMDGRKTMTRRVIKPQPAIMANRKPLDGYSDNMIKAAGDFPTPKYQPGDVLWVRETWNAAYKDNACTILAHYIYKATSPDIEHWRPSIFMPREAARLYLKVTDVRVERVQEIAPGDCFDEGIMNDTCYKCLCETGSCQPQRDVDVFCGNEDAVRDQFATLWDSINAKRGYGWDTNCWVWVISFERCERPGAPA